jgi:rod shape-determining protein MreC
VDLGRTPPPFFKQGPSALSRLAFFAALALLLMVADVRFKLTDPLRKALAAVLYPAEAAVLWPVEKVVSNTRDLQALREAQSERDNALKTAQALSLRAQQVELLTTENTRLRELLELKASSKAATVPGEIVYESRDAFSRRFVLNKGTAHGIAVGMPVIDAAGVVGQITRAYVGSSEVSAISDKDMAIPVQNARTGVRGVVYGDTSVSGALKLEFTAANADVQANDVLVTSGLDGVYPAGLQVARVLRVERQAESPFARIICIPLSGLDRGRHVLALVPLVPEVPRPAPEAPKDPRGRKLPASAAKPVGSEAAR